MTGPEHYTLAERLIYDEPGCMCEQSGCIHVSELLAAAQVHATLALAAATALRDGNGSPIQADWKAWLGAASAYEAPGKQATP